MGLNPEVVASSVGSELCSLGSFRRCPVCGARRWSGGSVARGIFGLYGFPFGSTLETEQSTTPSLFLFRVGVNELFGNHGISR